MHPDTKLEQINAYASSQVKTGLDEEAKAREQAQGANSILPHLQELRGLVIGKGPDDPENLVSVLGQFQGNTLFDLIAREVNKNGLTNGGIGKDMEASLANLKATPAQINRLQVLIKGLAQLQADKRDSANNPTNLYQYLQQQGSPTIANTGNAMVRMFDMAAAGARRERDVVRDEALAGRGQHLRQPGVDVAILLGQQLGSRLADQRNADGVDQPVERDDAPRLDGGHQVAHREVAPALALRDLCGAPGQAEDVARHL
jgi:hypothetical protein